MMRNWHKKYEFKMLCLAVTFLFALTSFNIPLAMATDEIMPTNFNVGNLFEGLSEADQGDATKDNTFVCAGGASGSGAAEADGCAPSQLPGEITACAGDPINPYDGKFFYSRNFLSISGRIPINLSLEYSAFSEFNGPVGYGWSHLYDMRLFKMSNSDIRIRRGKGQVNTYVDQGDDTYLLSEVKYEVLVDNLDGTYTLEKPLGYEYEFNVDGVLSEIRDPNGNRLILTHDAAGKLPITGVSPFSNITTPIVVAYDWRLVKIELESGGVLTGEKMEFNYNSNGRIVKAFDQRLREVLFIYDTDQKGDLEAVVDPEGNIYSYEYDSKHNMTRFVGLGCSDCTEHSNVYDNQGRVIRQVNGNQVFRLDYVDPLVKTVLYTEIYDDATRDLLGTRTDEFEYDVDGFITSQGSWRPDGSAKITNSYTYNSAKLPITKTFPNGLIQNLTYDLRNNLARFEEVIEADERRVTQYTYPVDSNFPIEIKVGSKASAIDPDVWLSTNTLEYDTLGNKTKDTLDGRSQFFSYGSAGDLIARTDAKGIVYDFERDDKGRLTRSLVDGVQGALIEYDDVENTRTVTDEKGNTTIFSYDSLDRLVSVENASGEKTFYTWDKDNLSEIRTGATATDPVGQLTTIGYDELNRRKRILRDDVALARYEYDSNGNVLEAMDANGNVVFNTYDILDRLITTTDALGNETQYAYDDSGNLVSVTDAESNVTQYSYDLSGQLVAVTDALLNVTGYGYDILGNVTSITDAETRTTGNEYDIFNRLTRVTDPMLRETLYTYDANDNLLRKTDENGSVADYGYDNKNQLISVNYSGGKVVGFDYDLAGNLTHLADGSITADYVYDTLNRVTNVATNYGAFLKAVNYSYDAFGNLDSLTDAEGQVSDYNYDAFNRLDTVVYPGSKTLDYDYDPAGRLVKKTLPNGSFTDYTYDSANRLLSLVNNKSNLSVISSFVYTHDNVGNRASMDAADGIHSYIYDDIYRLGIADHPTGTDESYTYDKVGNRKTNQDFADWTVNTNNELTSFDGVTFEYDQNGNRTREDDNSVITNYSYDEENRLAAVNANIAYSYDPFGKRISKTVDGVTTYYLYSNEDIIAKYDSTGNLIQKYWHGQGIDEPVAILDNTSVIQGYYLSDGLGSITELVDDTEAVVQSYAYDAFGNVLNQTGSLTQPYTYTSRELDPETGLYFYRARYYDAEAGRFLTEDPIGFSGGINFYGYVENDPVNWIDPLGLAMWYDELSGWTYSQTNEAKDIVFDALGDSKWGAYSAATIATVMDFGTGILHAPSALGHLGEGTGCFYAQPSWETAPGMLMDISLVAGVLALTGSQLNTKYYRYKGPGSKNTYNAKGEINNGTWVTKNKYSSFAEAESRLQIPFESRPISNVQEVQVPWHKYLGGPNKVGGNPLWGHGGGIEYRVGGF